MVSSFPYPVLTLKPLAPSYHFVSFRIKQFTSTMKARVSTLAPPQEFDYRTEMMEETISAVSSELPELMDLVDEGRLVMVEKRRFGPVPKWRRDFLEPEVIWLVGTSHTSQKSAEDVERVVRAVRPDNVVVELCRSRAGIMYTPNVDEDAPFLKSNMFSLGGEGFFGAVIRSLYLGGQTALAFWLLLAILSSKISLGEKQSFGDEFRAARKASEVIGAQIVLGDRPIEITLNRAWNSLVWSQKVRLLTSFFKGITSSYRVVSGSDLKDKELDAGPFQLYDQLSKSYPSLLQPLIYERDAYLAWSLKSSKAVNGSKRVVGVLGDGHLNGVVYALISDLGDRRFRDLAGEKAGGGSNGWMSSFLKSLLRDSILGFMLWTFYELLKDRVTDAAKFLQ